MKTIKLFVVLLLLLGTAAGAGDLAAALAGARLPVRVISTGGPVAIDITGPLFVDGVDEDGRQTYCLATRSGSRCRLLFSVRDIVSVRGQTLTLSPLVSSSWLCRKLKFLC